MSNRMLSWPLSKERLPAGRQGGIASFIVVFIIVILISLVSLGFARLMDRALRDVTNNQLSAAADYAAQSGINDVIAHFKNNPLIPVTTCDQLLGPGDPLENQASLTADGLTKYTCVLVNPLPGDLAFQNIPAYNSQVVKLAAANGRPLDQVMFSWEANNQTSTNAPATGNEFLNESAWAGSSRPPVLRITLYPINGTAIPNSGQIRTYYLYPNNAGGTATGYGTSSGTIIDGNCDRSPPPFPPPPFSDTGYQCNVRINNLGAVPHTYYVARLTTLYLAADIGIQAATASPTTLVQFRDAQSVIDVTGKSNDAVRRLQARAALGDPNDVLAGNDSIPENAIRSAGTICKRLIVPDAPPDTVFVDPASAANNAQACGFGSINPPTAPTVTLTATPDTVTVGQTVQIVWTVNGNGIPIDRCEASNDGSIANWTGAKATGGGTQAGVGPLNTARIYTFTLICYNIYNVPGTGQDTVTASPAPPPPPPPPPVTPPPPPPVPPPAPPPPSSGCPSPQSPPDPNDHRPNACVRGFGFNGWVSSGLAQFRTWSSHCYSGLNINGTGISWIASPSDNSDWYSYNIGFSNGGGGATITCSGAGSSWASTSVPPFNPSPPPPPPPPTPPPPPPPPPPASNVTDTTCYDSYVSDSTFWHRGACTADERRFGGQTAPGCYSSGGAFIHAYGC